MGAALADQDVHAVVLAIDSPGGVVAGNLDVARGLRAAADRARKPPMVAHAGTFATSAAYALAVAADRVMVTADGAVGSVGVIATVYDRTKMTADAGLDVRVVRSGALKCRPPHPDVWR
ncbi:MAG: S49 family peptidase [Polyangiales bacterium]